MLTGFAKPLELELEPYLLFIFDVVEFLTNLLGLDDGPFGQDCLTGEGLDSDDVVDEIGDALDDVTTASPSSLTYR